MRPRAARLALAVALLACGGEPPAPAAATPAPARRRGPQAPPPAMAECAECHARIVSEYLGHGMADSLGVAPPYDLPAGELANPRTGTRYAFEPGDPPLLHALRADGTHLAAAVVGRIGAGVAEVSYVGDRAAGLARLGLPAPPEPPGRLAFLPVEQFADGTPALAPFEHHGDVVFGQDLTAECLVCHTTADPAALPGAAADPQRRRIYPGAALGADALAHLPPLGCEACHGPAGRHAQILSGRQAAAPDDIGLPRLADLPAAAQRDVCARCHLDGELRVELHPLQGYGPRAGVLHAERPALVAAQPGDDFRFVAQVDRLALSACFRGAPDMTCTSCHDPHLPVAVQGPAAFDAACLSCHAREACVRPSDLRVEQVTGDPPRTPDGCADCHVRRSQPWDLGHVRTADHWVRRRIPPPAAFEPRALHDPRGALRVFDDGRLEAALATPAGRRWSDGLVALGLWKLGRPGEAAALLAQFPTPGSAAARTPSAPPGLTPLETSAAFHHLRGLVLEATGSAEQARAAYDDALALDETHAEARVNRASLRLSAGDVEGALLDAALLLQLYPRAEKGWNLRALAAAGVGDLDAACEALRRSVTLWPCDAATWQLLGRLELRRGRPAEAREALRAAAALDASLAGLAADLQAAGLR